MTDEEPPAERIELEPDLPPGMEPEEGEVTRRSVRYTPEQQGLDIPAGWKPSVRKPIPVVRCVYVRPDNHPQAPGERCNKWSMRGTRLCYFHSGRGNLKNVEEYRQAIIESARLRLTESVPDALETLFDLMANSGADNVRLKAVETILDRTGIRGGQDLNVQVEVSEANPALTLADRLQKLKDAAEANARKQAEAMQERERRAAIESAELMSPIETEDGEILEAEVVSDTADTADTADPADPDA